MEVIYGTVMIDTWESPGGEYYLTAFLLCTQDGTFFIDFKSTIKHPKARNMAKWIHDLYVKLLKAGISLCAVCGDNASVNCIIIDFPSSSHIDS